MTRLFLMTTSILMALAVVSTVPATSVTSWIAVSLVSAVVSWWLHPANASSRSRRIVRAVQRPSWLTLALRGILAGSSVGLVYAAIVAALFAWPSIYDLWRDRDRLPVEARLNLHESNHDWTDAISLIDRRTAQPASHGWTVTLQRRQYFDRLNAAAASVSPQTAFAELHRDVGDDDRLLSLIVSGLAAKAELPIWESRLLQSESEWESRARELAAAHLQTLLSAVEVAWDDPLEAQLPLDQADSLIAAWGLKSDRAQELRAIWVAPRTLPVGTTVTLIGRRDFPPLTELDIEVNTADGDAVTGLTLRDVRVRQSGKPLRRFTVSPQELAERELQLAIVVDCSGSMKNVHSTTVEGVRHLSSTLTGQVSMRLWSFADRVTAHTVWSDTASLIQGAVQQLLPGGGTALLQALETSAHDLNSRNGERRILLFSDGADSVGGPAIDAVIAYCRDHRITIDVLALETPQLDRALLKRAAVETGGQQFTATDAEQLPELFQQIGAGLRRSIYRVSVLHDEPDSTLLIEIGADSATALECHPANSHHTGARYRMTAPVGVSTR